MTYQSSLFDELSIDAPSIDDSIPAPVTPHVESIAMEDGELQLHHHWLTPGDAGAAFETLTEQLLWEQSQIQVYGKTVAIPRLNAWYGDRGCHYAYSGYQLPLNDWHPLLSSWRQRLQIELGVSLNSVLANLYRSGDDGVGWHADDEPELGEDPTIASISLGTERIFHLKHRFDRTKSTLKLPLPPGSMLVMSGQLQRYWLHSLPKTKRVKNSRINLTFRHIKSSG